MTDSLPPYEDFSDLLSYEEKLYTAGYFPLPPSSPSQKESMSDVFSNMPEPMPCAFPSDALKRDVSFAVTTNNYNLVNIQFNKPTLNATDRNVARILGTMSKPKKKSKTSATCLSAIVKYLEINIPLVASSDQLPLLQLLDSAKKLQETKA